MCTVLSRMHTYALGIHMDYMFHHCEWRTQRTFSAVPFAFISAIRPLHRIIEWQNSPHAHTHTHTDIRRRMPRAKLIKLIRKIFWVFFGLFIFAAQTSTSYEKRIEVSETKNVLGPNLSHRVFSFVPIPENLTFIFWACWTKCKVTADFRDVNRRNYMCECDTTELALCFSGTRAHTIFGRGSVISSSHNMMR